MLCQLGAIYIYIYIIVNHTSDVRIVGHTHSTLAVVLCHGNNAGTCSPVVERLLTEPHRVRGGIVIVMDEVITRLGILLKAIIVYDFGKGVFDQE